MVAYSNFHFRNPATIVLSWEEFKYNSLFGEKFGMRISYCQNTFSFLSTDLFSTHQNHELFQKCFWFFFFLLSSLLSESSPCHVRPSAQETILNCIVFLSQISVSLACYTLCVGHVLLSQGIFLVFLSVQLIFTPATTVAAVQSDIPVVSSSSSSSCQSAATQVSLSSFIMWYLRSGSSG